MTTDDSKIAVNKDILWHKPDEDDANVYLPDEFGLPKLMANKFNRKPNKRFERYLREFRENNVFQNSNRAQKEAMCRRLVQKMRISGSSIFQYSRQHGWAPVTEEVALEPISRAVKARKGLRVSKPTDKDVLFGEKNSGYQKMLEVLQKLTERLLKHEDEMDKGESRCIKRKIVLGVVRMFDELGALFFIWNNDEMKWYEASVRDRSVQIMHCIRDLRRSQRLKESEYELNLRPGNIAPQQNSVSPDEIIAEVIDAERKHSFILGTASVSGNDSMAYAIEEVDKISQKNRTADASSVNGASSCPRQESMDAPVYTTPTTKKEATTRSPPPTIGASSNPQDSSSPLAPPLHGNPASSDPSPAFTPDEEWWQSMVAAGFCSHSNGWDFAPFFLAPTIEEIALLYFDWKLVMIPLDNERSETRVIDAKHLFGSYHTAS